MFFFFFQAEDGIRDLTVTGVQTCALPILSPKRLPFQPPKPCHAIGTGIGTLMPTIPIWMRRPNSRATLPRSEERRVGKECRCWGVPDHLKRNRRKECLSY